MSNATAIAGRVHHAIQSKLVWVLLATYVLASFVPGPGLAMRAVTLGTIRLGGSSLVVTLPTLLLALLLFNASLGVNAGEVRALAKRPRVALVGLVANSALPLAFALASSVALRAWHNPDEVENLLVGLAIVGAMPIAGSSTAWAQNANGNLALSVGLVLASTILSPAITPVGFHAVASVTTGDYAEDLVELAGGGTQLFLALAVIVPSLAALVTRAVVGADRIAPRMPFVKVSNQAVIVALNYANAAVALPTVLRHPDWDYLALLFAVTASLCGLAFACGGWIARLAAADPGERASLMFAMGMNNNGSGLVLAATALADHPNVLLTIVAYNLVQQIAAGVADRFLSRASAPDAAAGAPRSP